MSMKIKLGHNYKTKRFNGKNTFEVDKSKVVLFFNFEPYSKSYGHIPNVMA